MFNTHKKKIIIKNKKGGRILTCGTWIFFFNWFWIFITTWCHKKQNKIQGDFIGYLEHWISPNTGSFPAKQRDFCTYFSEISAVSHIWHITDIRHPKTLSKLDKSNGTVPREQKVSKCIQGSHSEATNCSCGCSGSFIIE
jgi:hypothetical protein